MKPHLALAMLFAAAPLAVHAQQSGVSRPPDTAVEDLPPAASFAQKPSAAIPVEEAAPAAAPASVAAPQQEDFQAYKPLHSDVVLKARTRDASDPDAGIVLDVPRNPNELPVGTIMRLRLNDEIGTNSTQPDTPFTATLDQQVEDQGRIVLPAGATVQGRVTEVRGGRRIHGAALLHLQVQNVILPDGTRLPLHAAVVDTDQFADTRIDAEGNVVRKDHVGAMLTTMGLATGSAAAAGAVLGGGVGALVGAGIGAGVSTVVWLKQDRQAHLPKDSVVVVNLTEPMQIGPLAGRQDFSAAPARIPATSMTSSTSQASLPAAAPAYTAPQAFVPTN